MVDTWFRSSKRQPCPICGGVRCKVSPDGMMALCWRDGEVHVVKDASPEHEPIRTPVAIKDSRGMEWLKWSKLAFRHAVAHGIHETYSQSLVPEGMSVAKALYDLRMGWSVKSKAATFPMRNWSGQIVGIRLRDLNGRKWAVSGSSAGLMMPPEVIPGSILCICEGPTDTAVMLSCGFMTIGLPAASQGIDDAVEFARRLGRSVIICADDGPAGQASARKLEVALAELEPLTVRIVSFTPDVRGCLSNGRGTQGEIIHAKLHGGI